LQPQLDTLKAASRRVKVPYRICEVNSFSGGGRPGVSDTMASALWVLDYLFLLAANGCAGVNLETGVNQLGFVSSYSPIGDDETGHCFAKPEYYGMLAFAQTGKASLVKTQLDGVSAAIRAYATSQTGGPVSVTLVNKDSVTLAIHVTVTGGVGTTAGVLRLRGPALDAKSGITLGGAEVTPEGIWTPAGPERVPVQSGRFRVEVPAGSAAIVQIA
jgi:hypothetical protein